MSVAKQHCTELITFKTETTDCFFIKTFSLCLPNSLYNNRANSLTLTWQSNNEWGHQHLMSNSWTTNCNTHFQENNSVTINQRYINYSKLVCLKAQGSWAVNTLIDTHTFQNGNYCSITRQKCHFVLLHINIVSRLQSECQKW